MVPDLFAGSVIRLSRSLAGSGRPNANLELQRIPDLGGNDGSALSAWRICFPCVSTLNGIKLAAIRAKPEAWNSGELQYAGSLFLAVPPKPCTRSIKGLDMHKMSRQRVLIVDDECIIADTLALILDQHGFETRAVYSGEHAVETAPALKPNVLISDVVMRGMNGIEAALRISVILPDCRIILFSGNAATADLLHDAKVHGHNFEILTKPVHPQVLLDRLMSLEPRASR